MLNIAEYHQQVKQKRDGFLHKLSNYSATEHDVVAVEDLNVKSMLESVRNIRNMVSAASDTFTTSLAYNCNAKERTLSK